jgi:hypothetical protein
VCKVAAPDPDLNPTPASKNTHPTSSKPGAYVTVKVDIPAYAGMRLRKKRQARAGNQRTTTQVEHISVAVSHGLGACVTSQCLPGSRLSVRQVKMRARGVSQAGTLSHASPPLAHAHLCNNGRDVVSRGVLQSCAVLIPVTL